MKSLGIPPVSHQAMEIGQAVGNHQTMGNRHTTANLQVMGQLATMKDGSIEALIRHRDLVQQRITQNKRILEEVLAIEREKKEPEATELRLQLVPLQEDLVRELSFVQERIGARVLASAHRAGDAATNEPGEPKMCMCFVCLEKFPESICARVDVCEHDICRTCAERFFRGSLSSEKSFPPLCCGKRIKISNVRKLLPDTVVAEYSLKLIEFETVDRTYCSNPTCSVFINPKEIVHDKAKCPKCKTVTCALCKMAAHDGACIKDEAFEKLITTAEAEGWKQCYNCNRMVELIIGCKHMRCHCGAEFCYECGKKWRTCFCSDWNGVYIPGQLADILGEGVIGLPVGDLTGPLDGELADILGEGVVGPLAREELAGLLAEVADAPSTSKLPL